jgi:beta-phosphoglucomutase-like phosphatase (HAD superfamily)
MSRLKEVEAAMVEHTLANRDKVSEGLALLPGVKELLEKLQVGRCWRKVPGAATGGRG